MSSLIMMVAPTPARRDHLAGAHIVATLVPRHWEHLWAGTLDVSQPLLDADMERHHVHVWGASNARHRRLQRRRMYPLLATRTSTDTAFCSVERGRLRVRNPVDLHYPYPPLDRVVPPAANDFYHFTAKSVFSHL